LAASRLPQSVDVRANTHEKTQMCLVVLALTICSWADTAREKVEDRLERATEVLQEMMNAPDKGIPEEVIKNAQCIAVVPHEIGTGFVVGARIGKGVATCRTASGWSAPEASVPRLDFWSGAITNDCEHGSTFTKDA
jgi:hypothetical protein